MQFMDDAIWTLLQQGIVSPHEAFMKAIDKNLFRSSCRPTKPDWPTPLDPLPDDHQRPARRFRKGAIGGRAKGAKHPEARGRQ